MRIMVINVTLMQINSSVDSMIPIEWPEIWLTFKSYFEWADIDIVSLSGTTCVAGVNFFLTFAAMGSIPYVIVLTATLFYFYQKCTLHYRLTHMSKEERSRRQQDAYVDAFLLADKNGDGTITPIELATLLNHELHLDHFRRGKFKIDVSHALQIIRKLSGDPTTLELPLMLFLNAMETDSLNKAVNEVCELPANHSDSSKEAMLHYIVERGLFSASFMLACHMLLLAHAPVSKKVFVFYLCRDIGGRSFIRSDYSIECYGSEWTSFQPAVMFVLLTFTVGFPALLMGMMLYHRNRLYRKDVYARMGFLYERYVRGGEWWEIHEMMRKVVLTGLLLFTSERPMVRAVCATMVCCTMIVNLNYFQPHRNLIVFWVEQLANLSATIKYLFAVVIAGGGGSEGVETGRLGHEDLRMMGYLLIASDISCMVISFFAMIACVMLLRKSIAESKKLAAANGIVPLEEKSELHRNVHKRLSMTSVTPQAHRRATLRHESPAARGLSAMMEHANDHLVKKGFKKKSLFNFSRIMSKAIRNEKVQVIEKSAAAAKVKHTEALVKKQTNAKNRLQARLIMRKKTSTVHSAAAAATIATATAAASGSAVADVNVNKVVTTSNNVNTPSPPATTTPELDYEPQNLLQFQIQAMERMMQKLLSKKCGTVKKLRKVFDKLDDEHSGSLSESQFSTLCKLMLKRQTKAVVPDNLSALLHGAWKLVLGDEQEQEQENEINFQRMSSWVFPAKRNNLYRLSETTT